MRLLQNSWALFLILNISWANSQSIDFPKYDALAWNAMLEFKDKDFKKSLDHFNKAFEIIADDSADDYFYAAAAALNNNDSVTAKRFIIDAIEKTNAPKVYFLSFEEFNAFRKLPMFADILSNFENHQSNFYKRLENPEIFKEIEKMRLSDQEVRKDGGRHYENVDSQNIDRLIEITKEYGWQKNAWLLLWHQRSKYNQDYYVWSFFRPFIDNEISNKTIRPDFWARFEDAASMEKTGKQIYGLYMGDYANYPIVDLANIDKRRTELGMPPLWFMEKVYGFVPPKNYKSPDNQVLPIINN